MILGQRNQVGTYLIFARLWAPICTTSLPESHITSRYHIYLLRKARHSQIDTEQLSKTTRMTRTALTVALNN